MKILSLFDGISCARVALERAGIPVEFYYASEIDKYAIQIAKKNYPSTILLQGVEHITKSVRHLLPEIDLLIGGSPCQDLSIAKRNRKGLDGERSGLFYEYVRILREVKPKYFILENVASMPKQARDLISKELGVQPVMINAALVSAQQRKRLFWVGAYSYLDNKYYQVMIPQPQDRNILLKDILIDGIETKEKSLCITATYSRACPRDYFENSSRQLIKVGEFFGGGQGGRVYSVEGKSVSLSALGGGGGAKTGLYEVPTAELKALTERRTEEAKRLRKEHREKTGKDYSPRREKELVPRDDGKMNTITTAPTKENIISDGYIYRKLHPIECERLQGLPDNYTEGISNTQRYKCCGNAFNVDVVAHILSIIKKHG